MTASRWPSPTEEWIFSYAENRFKRISPPETPEMNQQQSVTKQIQDFKDHGPISSASATSVVMQSGYPPVMQTFEGTTTSLPFVPMTSEIKPSQHAYTFLEEAAKQMKDRAAQRDTTSTQGQAGERSMQRTVQAFNALTGKYLTEEEGWEFMILLKLVRGRQGDFRADDYVDAAAYSGLLGECASKSR